VISVISYHLSLIIIPLLLSCGSIVEWNCNAMLWLASKPVRCCRHWQVSCCPPRRTIWHLKRCFPGPPWAIWPWPMRICVNFVAVFVLAMCDCQCGWVGLLSSYSLAFWGPVAHDEEAGECTDRVQFCSGCCSAPADGSAWNRKQYSALSSLQNSHVFTFDSILF